MFESFTNKEKGREMATLDDKAQKLLEEILLDANRDVNKLKGAITKALLGVTDPARREYLWNELNRRAKEKIRREQRKSMTTDTPSKDILLRNDPVVRRDAFIHEQQISSRISEKDR